MAKFGQIWAKLAKFGGLEGVPGGVPPPGGGYPPLGGLPGGPGPPLGGFRGPWEGPEGPPGPPLGGSEGGRLAAGPLYTCHSCSPGGNFGPET